MKRRNLGIAALVVLAAAGTIAFVLMFSDAPGVRFLQEVAQAEVAEEEGPTIFSGTEFEKLALAARAIQKPQDLERVMTQVSEHMETTGSDPDFVLMEGIIADRVVVVAAVAAENEVCRLETFIYSAKFGSTRNLLIIKLLEAGKLGDSKQNLLRASEWPWLVKPAPNGYQRRVPEVKKALLDAAIARKDSGGALTLREAEFMRGGLGLSAEEWCRFIKDLGFL